MPDLSFLRRYFKTQGGFTRYLSKLEDMFWAIKSDFEFLCFSDETWNYLLVESIKRNITKLDVDNVNDTLRYAVLRHIKSEAKKRKTYFLNNILINLRKESANYRDILKRFIRILESYNIIMDEEYFQLLVKGSPFLAHILKSLGIEETSFDDLKGFLYADVKLLYFRNPSYDRKQNEDLFDYVLSCMKGNKEVILNDVIYKKKTEDYLKIKMFIENHQYILKIHDLYKEVYGDTDDKLLDIAILDLSLKELEDFLNAYRQFIIAYNKDYTFLYKINKRVALMQSGNKTQDSSSLEFDMDEIYSSFNRRNKISQKEHKEILDEAFGRLSSEEKKVLKSYYKKRIMNDEDAAIARKALDFMRSFYLKRCNQILWKNNPVPQMPKEVESVEKATKPLRAKTSKEKGSKPKTAKPKERKTICERIEKPEGVSIDDHQALIYHLMRQFPQKIQVIMKGYEKGENDNDDIVDKFVIRLRRMYHFHFADIKAIQYLVNEVPKCSKTTAKKHEDVIKKIYDELGPRNKMVIRHFVAGDILPNDVKFKNVVSLIKDSYFEIIPEEIKKTRKSIEDRFTLIPGITEEQKGEFIKTIFDELELHEQLILQSYIDKEFDSKDERYQDVKNILRRMNTKYQALADALLNPRNEQFAMEKLISQFKLSDEITEDIRAEIVKTLFAKKDEVEQKLVIDYLNDVDLEEKDKKRAKTIITIMKNYYRKHGRNILDSPDVKGRKKFYSYFKIQNGMTEEERNRIIDVLLDRASDEDKNTYDLFLKGGIYKTDDYGKFVNLRDYFRKVYNEYGIEILNPEFIMPPRNHDSWYDFFPLYGDIIQEKKEKE